MMDVGQLTAGGMAIAIMGFLAFDYKARKEWQKQVFGFVYVFFGAIFVMLAGFIYQQGNLEASIGIYGMGVSFATLGFLSIGDALVKKFEKFSSVIRAGEDDGW